MTASGETVITVPELLVEHLEQRAPETDGQRHIFEPQSDFGLVEVIAQLKSLNISASSDEYLHPAFPQSLKRQFAPLLRGVIKDDSNA